MNPAVLALEDGTVFEGQSFGAPVERAGEVVFNTAITGYQEIFTDPSYSGQIVVLTNPQIGNYGANDADNEAVRPYIEGLVVREFSPLSSNWRSEETAQDFLAAIGRSGDHRHRYARAGAASAVARRDARRACRRCQRTRRQLVEKARQSPSMTGLDLATRVSTQERYEWELPVEACSPSEHVGDAEGRPVSRGRLRFRNEAQYPAAAGAGGLPPDGGSGRDFRRRRAGAETRAACSSRTVRAIRSR